MVIFLSAKRGTMLSRRGRRIALFAIDAQWRTIRAPKNGRDLWHSGHNRKTKKIGRELSHPGQSGSQEEPGSDPAAF
ncbi:MAG: hypothetical protein ACREB7_18455 [Sphingopyxis sp.]|uniref:hypothetical protein n=1 Tax=Sphingopyxis sp. TaxID=1908224 RepID=UPI003D6CE686